MIGRLENCLQELGLQPVNIHPIKLEPDGTPALHSLLVIHY